MKTLGKLPILLYLSFMCSFAYSGVPEKEQFNFLSQYNNNASLVESSLKLTGSVTGLAISTLLNYGLWYTVCESTHWFPALAGRFGLSSTEEFKVHQYESSFSKCNELAAAITLTEIAVVEHVSPWPVKNGWWQPLRFTLLGGTVFVSLGTINEHNRHLVPLIALTLFSGEVVSRTVAGTIATQALRYQDKLTIQPSEYAYGESISLSLLTGAIVGSIIYDIIKSGSSSHLEAAYGYVLPASLTGIISAIISVSALDREDNDIVQAMVIAGFGAPMAGFGIKALAAMTILVGAVPGVLPGAGCNFGVVAGLLAGIGAGVGAGAAVMGYQMYLISILDMPPGWQLDRRRLLRKLAVLLTPALALAMINGVSNYLVYGVSLEECLTETAWNQWQKFYAPLDYLHTLFN
ncbi:hypothetical protein [Endozoicomonas sp. 4G]|uniref:hypothetical protein n=1 Tax=Endozoicomonas sp. 4G TaxID=2872754 RepID=UPI0020788477|nr:hypothetical protein [Endozoicomonas sp. 4G]